MSPDCQRVITELRAATGPDGKLMYRVGEYPKGYDAQAAINAELAEEGIFA